MTRRDTLKCIHEPFGDAFYYGAERLSTRFENDEQTRVDSGFENSTYQTVLDRFDTEGAEVRLSFYISMAFPDLRSTIPHSFATLFTFVVSRRIFLLSFVLSIQRDLY